MLVRLPRPGGLEGTEAASGQKGGQVVEWLWWPRLGDLSHRDVEACR